MPLRLTIGLLFVLLVASSRDGRALLAQSTIDTLNVQLSGAGSGYKIVRFTDGTMQRVDWQAEVAFDLTAVRPVQQGSLFVFDLPDYEGRIRFWGTAVDDHPVAGQTWIFDREKNVQVQGGAGTLHYSLPQERVTFIDYLLPAAFPVPPEAYRISYFGVQPADVDSVRAYIDMPAAWFFSDPYHMPGLASDPIIPGIEEPLSSEPHPMKVHVESGRLSYVHPDNEAAPVSERVSITARFLHQVQAERAVSVQARIGRPDGRHDALALYDDATHGDRLAQDGIYSGEYTLTAPGNYDVTASAQDGAGQTFEGTAFINLTIEQTRPPPAQAEQPDKTGVSPSYPNPFTAKTEIAYHLPRHATVLLRIYSMTGRLVQTLVDAKQAAGRHMVSWDGRDRQGRRVASGVYLYQLDVEGRLHTGTMVFIKE